MGKLSEKRITNCSLTKKIIRLHNEGYTFDFHVISNDQIICIQDGTIHCFLCTAINVLDQCYDVITHTYKYVHTIETACGYKGLLVADRIYTALSIAAKQESLKLQFA